MEDTVITKPGVQISEKDDSIEYIEGNSEEEFNPGRHHSSEEFIRFRLDSEDQWSQKYYYVVCCMLIGTNHGVFPLSMHLAAELSGGSFLLLLIAYSLIVGLPFIYMETFLGRYTKLTNSQMYRMVPIFFGFCLGVLAINIMILPTDTVSTSQLMVNLLMLLANPSINTKCLDNSSGCYDYQLKGKLNDTCVYKHISMLCEKHGEIRYLMEYQYWKTYKDPSSNVFPYSQLITGVVITWILILIIVKKKLQVIGSIVNVAFIIQALTYTITFVLALIKNGGTEGLHALVNVNFSKLSILKVLTVQWYSLWRLGIIVPTGFMTFSAYGGFGYNIGSDCFIIIACSILLAAYYLAIFFTVCGVIAQAMGVAVEAVILHDRGLFLAVVPQFLVQLQMPNIFLVIYYGCVWYSETVRTALYVHMLILNLYDFFPALKNFPLYIWITSCFVFCLISIPACGRFASTEYIPTLSTLFLMVWLGVSICVEVTMVSYFYGVGRLCNDIYFLTGHQPVRFLRCMWYLIPFIGWVSVFFTVTKLKEENTKKLSDAGQLYAIVTLAGAGCFSIISTFMYVAFRFGNPNLLIKLFKPQYFWGPSDREVRVERKNFYPNVSIRSQQFHSRMKNENENLASVQHGVLLSEFSRDIIEEQVGKGDILKDKMFFRNIGVDSQVKLAHAKRTLFSKEKGRELDEKGAT